MEVHSIYAFTLHGESPKDIHPTDKQASLIHTFNLYDDINDLLHDIVRLDIVKRQHSKGFEFCGDIKKEVGKSSTAEKEIKEYLKFRSYTIVKDSNAPITEKLIMMVKGGYPLSVAAHMMGVANTTAQEMMRKAGYEYDNKKYKWVLKTEVKK